MKTKSNRHRTSPIQDSITKIGGGYPDKLVIFQSQASPFWWVRYYTQKKILKKSTKTTNKFEAIKFAKTFYEDTLLRERNLLPISASPTFERCANELIIEQERLIERGERSSRLNVDDKQKLSADILPYFRGFDIRNVTYKHIDNYIATLSARNLKPPSLKKHSILIHKIFMLAQREGLVDRIPTMPSIRQKDSPRGWFDRDEYKLLRKVTGGAINNKIVVRSHPITGEIFHLITMIVNSFLRPSDIKNLRNRNIQIIEKDFRFLRIQPESSKTINTPIVTMEFAVDTYQQLLTHHKELGSPVGPDDYVFFPKIPNRNFALATMRRQFEWILDKAGLKIAPGGEPRTLYSLRHTAIMFRLTEGDNIDLLTLARNARTSVAMIERFYAKPLSGEMNVDKIQSKRVKSTKPSV